ncbi:acylphosphatase [Estrella lausannensis]|uniref:acylphosphatase n=1 Tax=Estrella lausannensis TaxID=483423 RepID=A0A0H5DN58_9BACT|nr:acylphosphatase [Estrella lausannensis]CRX37527.1 Acylphosphatase [Estrella lausannensis]
MTDNPVELFAKVHGRVQGVFFRATVERFAKEMGIRGFVENKADGTVEIVAQGTKQDLEMLIHRIQEHPGEAEIDSMNTNFREIAAPLTGFKVKR